MLDIKELPPFETEYELSAASLDIETDGLDPKNHRVLAIGLKNPTGQMIFCHDDEAKLLREFAKIFNGNSHKGIWLCGHNIIAFDLMFIIERCQKHNIEINIKYSQDRAGNCYVRSFVAGGQLKWKYKSIVAKGYQIVDTLILTHYWDAIHATLPDRTLKTAVIEFGLRADRRLELSAKEIIDSFHGDKKKLIEYLSYDLEDTLLLARHLLPAYYYMQTVVPMTLQEMILSTTAKKVEKIMESHYLNSVLPEPDDTSIPISGAITYSKEGLYTNVFKLDVSSLYPSIMLRYGCYPKSKDPDKFFLIALKYLTEERLKHKKLSKTNKVSAGINEAYKILINSFFGFLSSAHAYNDVANAERVTAYGRKIITLICDVLTKNGCEIIEVDTDGVYAKSEIAATEITDMVNRSMPTMINVELETIADWIYVHAAKNYVVKEPEKLIKKGIYKKRDRTPLFLKFTLDGINAALISPEEFRKLYDKYDQEIINGIDLKLLMFHRTVAVTWKRLLALGNPGDKIVYYEGYNIAGEAIPTKTGPYNIVYYRKELKKWASEMHERIFKCVMFREETLETYNLF